VCLYVQININSKKNCQGHETNNFRPRLIKRLRQYEKSNEVREWLDGQLTENCGTVINSVEVFFSNQNYIFQNAKHSLLFESN